MSDATGPTGTQEPEEIAGPTGDTGPTGAEQVIMNMFPSAGTGSVEAPSIATMDELLASREATIAQEAADRSTLGPLLNPSRDQFRPHLFQWAAAGFPAGYVVQTMALNPPGLCSDGVVRDLPAYTWYLLGTEIADLLVKINSMLTGIVTSFSFAGNSLLLHVNKS
jgi:hypothetical protein